MATLPKLPVFEMKLLSEDDGVEFVALVDDPAIDHLGFGSGLFIAFSNQEKVHFKVTSEKKRIISGPLLIPDAEVFRKDEHGEYYVKFSKDTVYNTLLRIFKNGYTQNVNLNHDEKEIVKDVYMFEAFIIDRERMSPPKGFEDLPDGTIFCSYKVDNEKVWGQVEDGTFKGLSIHAKYTPVKSMSEANLLSQIEAILNS